MKVIIAAITIGLYSVEVFSDPCMDAYISPLGYITDLSPEEVHLSRHGC